MEVTNDGSDTPDEVNNSNESLSNSDPLPYPGKPNLTKLSFHNSLETMPKRERFLKEQRKSETNFNKQPSVVFVDNEDLIRKSISSPTTLSPLVASNPNPAPRDGKPEVDETSRQNNLRTDSPLQKLGKFFRKRGPLSENDPNAISMQSLDQYVQYRENRRMRKSREQLHVNVIPEPTPQTQTLVELVRSKWEKSADKLPIHSDLPRLLKHIEIMNSEGETIMTRPEIKKPYVVSKKILRNFLETLAIELADTRDILPNIIQHFGHSSPYEEDDEDADLSVEVRLFIKSYMQEESPTLRVLKAITQTIIAAPFVELKQQFAAIGCEFVDVSGTWGIKVSIGPGDGSVTDKVIITHTKGGRSATDQGFEFVWELALQFDRNMKDLEGLSLTIPEITFASDYSKDKKKDIQKLISRWSGSTRRSTIRRSRTTSIDPSPRVETASEKKAVKELLGSNATLQYMQWGTVTMNGKIKERLFVVSNYRVLLINKSQLFGQKKKIYEGHLFNLLGLSILEADKIKMKFIDSTFELNSSGISVAVDLILNSYRKIQYCLPIIRPPIEISPLRHPSDAIITKRGIISIEEAGNRVIDSYVAYCEYYKTPIRKQIIAYLTSLISSGNRHLRLDAIPDSDPLDLEPVAAALKYDTFFDMLTLSNTPRRDAILKLSLTVEYSKTLTHLTLSGLYTEDGFVELGNAIKRNVACRLVSIDLSNNTIRDKSMSELAHGIASLKFLRILRLAHCNIGPNGMVDLMKEMSTNKLIYETLEELDFSGNPIGTIGSGGICSWISLHNKSLQILKNVRLVSLNLSNCSCDLYSIFDNLRKSPFRYSIENVDISHNKLDGITFEAVCKFNNSSVALRNLRMISCGVSSKQCKLILQSISNNHLLQSVTIDLSHNNLGTDVGGLISACLLISKNISGLVLRSNDIKKEGLTQLIHAAAINGCVQLLDISHNKCGVNSKVIQALSDLIAESKVETLNLAGLTLGPELGTIFTSLVSNTTLKHLDITKNHCGDSSAHILFEALKVNKSLVSLRYDSNNITLVGWKSFRDCMKYNKTLSSCPLPQKDIRASVSLIYSRDRNTIQNSIATLMSEIQQSLKLNQLGISPYRSVGVTRSYSNICTSSCRLSVSDVCWFSVWDDCNGNLLPYLESSFRLKSGEDVGKALQITHEQAKSIMGDVTTISVAVIALHKNKTGNRVINIAIAGPVKVMLWGIEGVFMDIDGKDTMLGKEKIANIELNGGCSHVIMGSKVFWESIDDECVVEVMKTMHHSSEQASNKLHKTVLERGVKEHFTVSVIAV